MFYFSNIGFFKSQGFNPIDLNPLFWFDASYGVTESGGLVSQWEDKSGNGHDVYQATGSRQPTYEASSTYLNSYPTVVFGNGNVYTSMANTTSSLGSEVVNVMTMVVAIKNTVTNQFLFNYVNSLSAGGERRFTWQFANSQVYMYSSSSNVINVRWNWAISEPDYTPFVLTYRYDSSLTGIQRTKLFVNGVYITSWVSSGAFSGISTTNTGFVLGNRRDADTISVDAHIAEAIFIQNINQLEQNELQNYYMTKYNIP